MTSAIFASRLFAILIVININVGRHNYIFYFSINCDQLTDNERNPSTNTDRNRSMSFHARGKCVFYSHEPESYKDATARPNTSGIRERYFIEIQFVRCNFHGKVTVIFANTFP